MDLSSALVQFMRQYSYALSPRTRASYQSIIQVHLVPALGLRDVRSITKHDLIMLHAEMAARPYQANRTLALLSRLYTFLGLPNPAKGIRRYHERTRETYLTPQQMIKLFNDLAAHPSKPFVTAILLLLLTGARRNEILCAKWADVNFNRKQLIVPSSKTGKKYIVLNEIAIKLLEEVYDPRNTYIIPGSAPDKPRVNITKAWRRIAPRNVRIHDLRHTFASLIANTNASIFTLKDLLHHASVVTTQRYAHLFDATLRETSNKAGNDLIKAGLEIILQQKEHPERK